MEADAPPVAELRMNLFRAKPDRNQAILSTTEILLTKLRHLYHMADGITPSARTPTR